MTKNSSLKRLALPGALLAGGLAAGAFLSPIGLASAQSDTENPTATTVETPAGDTGTGTDADARDEGHRGGPMGDRGHGMGRGIGVLTETLGLSPEELRAAFAEGASLADIAAEQGVSTEDLKAALTQSMTEHLDQAVADGRLTREEADAKVAEMDSHIDEMINQAPGEGGHRMDGEGHHGHHGDRGPRGFGPDALAEALGLTHDELHQGLQDGRTVAELAAEQGVSESDLVDSLVAAATEHIDEQLAQGEIDAATADARKAELEERVTAMVEGEMPFAGPRPGHDQGHGHGSMGSSRDQKDTAGA